MRDTLFKSENEKSTLMEENQVTDINGNMLLKFGRI
jgi:hypothetical protein